MWKILHNYNYDEMPFSASQQCFNKRGVSYTPPGWKREYKRIKRSQTESKPPAAKKMKYEEK